MSAAPERAEVLVIGAGASGAVVSRALAEAGVAVTCLEQGEWIGADQYASDRIEREVLQEGSWHVNPNHRCRAEDYPCEVSESEIHPLMFNAVGGSTVHYAAEWTRLLPSDFRVRTLDGLADDARVILRCQSARHSQGGAAAREWRGREPRLKRSSISMRCRELRLDVTSRDTAIPSDAAPRAGWSRDLSGTILQQE